LDATHKEKVAIRIAEPVPGQGVENKARRKKSWGGTLAAGGTLVQQKPDISG
jgi:hypothetical protein